MNYEFPFTVHYVCNSVIMNTRFIEDIYDLERAEAFAQRTGWEAFAVYSGEAIHCKDHSPMPERAQ